MTAAFLPRVTHPLAAAALVALAACSGKEPTNIVTEEPVTQPGCAVPVQRAMNPGESVVLAAGQNCVELATPGSRYMVGVVHTGKTVSSVSQFELVGSTRGSTAAPVTTPLANLVAEQPGRSQGLESDARVSRHARVLDLTRDLIDRLGAPAASGSGSGASFSEAPLAPTSGLRTVGDTATLRIPDINAANACTKFYTVKTRVVHVSERAIVLEDVAAPLANQMDDTYRAIGQEFDAVMWPILTNYFGNPLRLDSQLDANGRIVMLFSSVVNQNFPDVAGFVVGCDFYPRAQLASSNEGEIFYAMVPKTKTSNQNSNESLDGWLRTMRSTLIHEAKHITAFAERIASDAGAEDSWMEEGTARHSEEIYARRLSGTPWESNAGYEAIACEVRPASSGCLGRPYVMFKHFDALYDALASDGMRSPLGKANADDYTFYATAWALVRWAADLAPDEAAFFRALTAGPKVGVANLEAVTGRPWAEIVADWTMAMALDDVAGLTPARSQDVSTWNLRSVYTGMARDFPDFYSTYPVRPVQQRFGAFTVPSRSVRAGAGALLELTGTWAGPQVVELRLPGGGTPAGALRLVVTRVQ